MIPCHARGADTVRCTISCSRPIVAPSILLALFILGSGCSRNRNPGAVRQELLDAVRSNDLSKVRLILREGETPEVDAATYKAALDFAADRVAESGGVASAPQTLSIIKELSRRYRHLTGKPIEVIGTLSNEPAGGGLVLGHQGNGNFVVDPEVLMPELLTLRTRDGVAHKVSLSNDETEYGANTLLEGSRFLNSDAIYKIRGVMIGGVIQAEKVEITATANTERKDPGTRGQQHGESLIRLHDGQVAISPDGKRYGILVGDLLLQSTENILNAHIKAYEARRKSQQQVNEVVTALVSASYNGQLNVVRALLATRVDVNGKSKGGTTALIAAAMKDRFGVARELLANGADVNAKSDDGFTALIVASYTGHVDVARLLLAKGADVNAKSKDGSTALMAASAKGHLDIVQAVLAKRADINAKSNEGTTALIMASGNDHVDVMRALLEAGADVNAKSDTGTALMKASGNGHLAVVHVLLANGAEVNAKSNDGFTALMLASYTGHLDIVRVLLEAGAEVNTKSNDGTTALMAASRQAHPDVVDALVAKGADVNAK